MTPSLLASILNAKYVNSSPLYRIEQEFIRNGVNISRQTMANWITGSSDRYFAALVERMKQELFTLPVTQSDETPTQVINDDRHPGSKSYMWVHRSGEFFKDRPIVIYEYQKGRDHELPLAFYRNYKGILVTDGLKQYHLVEDKLEGLVNANCWAHARRDYADSIKAADKANPNAVKRSIAYQALSRISLIYKLEGTLKDLSAQERLQERQRTIKPLVEEYFAWVKKQLEDMVVPPKGKTAEGLRYSVNQEKYLKVFLADLNNLRPYYYFNYLLTELPKLCDEKGTIDTAKLEHLLPWAQELPEECRKPCR